MSRLGHYCRFEGDTRKKRNSACFMTAFLAGGTMLALSGCNVLEPNPDLSPRKATLLTGEELPKQKPRVGLILPLTGPQASIGLRLREAALLALPNGKEPGLDIFDETQEGGATGAAYKALKAGDKIVLGPLTSGSTEKVAEVLQTAGVPELAFTSDLQQARSTVWIMGLTPEQQVKRLVDAAQAEGRKSFAAFLPDNALGHAMGNALVALCQQSSLELPKVAYHADDENAINTALASFMGQMGASSGNSDGAQSSSEPSAIDPLGSEAPAPPVGEKKTPSVKPSFDALLLGDTGLALGHVIDALQERQIGAPQVRIMGPMLWKSFDGKLGALQGAWYPAFDDRLRERYVQNYQAAYHTYPSPVSDFSYDAAALAGALVRDNKLDKANLTRPNGFAGLNGTFWLKSDGHVERSLVIYQILPGGGARMVVPGRGRKTQPAAPVARR